MNNPELYDRTNELPQKEVREFLAEYIHLVRGRQDGSDSVMDIGCGSGNVTTQILLPLLPESLTKLVAIDLSPQMIQYARRHHAQPQVSYEVLDISTKELPAGYYERFNQIYSLLCLHWVHDQRQAMQNIFDMLRPGGDILLLYFARNPSFDVLLKLASVDQWKPYMKDPRRFNAVYQDVENVEELLYDLLHEVGFVNITCECRPKEHVFENMNTFMDLMTAVDPIIPQLPAHLKEKYYKELYNEHSKQALVEGFTSNETDTVSLPYTMIMIHARKL